MPRKKRKLSAYNIFVRRQVKAGKSFSQAARAWKGGTTRKIKTRTRTIRSKPKRSGFVMARRRTSARRSSTRGFNLMKGIIPVRGIVASAIIGLGAAVIAQRFAPSALPQQNLLVAGAVGGLPGAAAAYFIQGAFGAGGNGITYF